MAKIKVTFSLSPDKVAGAESGILLGDFNDWDIHKATRLEKMNDGSMVAELMLPLGKTFHYRYLMSDGRWVNDHAERVWLEAFGGWVENCVITVSDDRNNSKKTDDVAKVPKKIKASTKKAKRTDDFGLLSAITRKMENALKDAGVTTFSQLSKLSGKKLIEIFEKSEIKIAHPKAMQIIKESKVKTKK